MTDKPGKEDRGDEKRLPPRAEGSIPLPTPPAWMTRLPEIRPEPAPQAAAKPAVAPGADASAEAPRVEVRPPSRESSGGDTRAPDVSSHPFAPAVESAEEKPAQLERVHWTGDEEDEVYEAAYDEDQGVEDDDEDQDERLLAIDPAFVFVIIAFVALFGLTNFAPDARYTLVWSALALVGTAAILIDHVPVERPTFRDLMLGAGYGAMIGLPMLIIGGPQLKRMSLDIFGRLGDTAVFQALAFAMPMADTLFFRGALQAARGVIPAGLAAGAWSVILFLPALNVINFPLVAVVIALAFVFVNFLYSYLRERIGLFSAWACQIVVNLLLLWASRLIA